MRDKMPGGRLEIVVGAVGISSMLKEPEAFVRIVDHNFVIAQKIITNNAIELRADGLTEHRKEIGHDHGEIVDLSAADLKRLERAGRNIDMCATTGDRRNRGRCDV